ncbi:MAG TPA: S-methyl-5-thioribose-1-phosphate isomerase [Ignavibacteriales bacterium]|nr:S-methyl-5-thioribose-1-phosphate isomerase [Ignavibacteriales bacterium]HOL81194.1 S-methyl-5-thioribose-1-phosphate isomerase [Ignavibacteriales bacterium]HOM65297.1 S-methyl-5-thioribose-1-phosphate isomerase [Ignavibacteriales bacterium]HPD68115.1 S-methyl-5-thioribose-1-phosphate isomerase [Ignavibacteriales bacterium]HPP33450.1 S-methyl-5-thioribose-1-phosphate isomerase [Ignavibacteriales bacterium]
MKVLEYNNCTVTYLNQTKLPLEEEFITTDNYEALAQAIEKLEIRGAPLIGIAAAYGIVLGIKQLGINSFDVIYNRLASTRPTAVNLFWALNEMKAVYENYYQRDDLFNKLEEKAIEIHNQDRQMCFEIAQNGLSIFQKKSRVLTHCNAGELATGGIGTALGVIKKAFENNLIELVYVDETRPLLQGSRLTTFELEKYGIPFKVICDNMAASLMKNNEIDLIITGADRIAINGDAANKIGTYSVAVLAKYHNIPFYMAAPSSSIDKNITSGDQIIIEMRKSEEILKIKTVDITKNTYEVYNPSFDVTPSNLIAGIITEKKVFNYPYNFNEKNC